MSDHTDWADTAWGKLFGGACCLGLAYYMHQTFTELETGARESARINWIFALLYENFGHGITVGIMAVFGALILIWGVRQLFTE